jgi:FAD/FMN-containing dehydrogenase
MTGLDRIIRVDPQNMTVTAEAGVRLYALAEALARHGLELIGNHEMMGRTLGGAIASPALGPGIGRDAAALGRWVLSLKLATCNGKMTTVNAEQRNLMGAIRSSYGLLGAIIQATLKVRPITTFAASHRKLDIGQFCGIVDRLSNADVGFRFYLLPHRDRVYLDLRRHASAKGSAHSTPWRFKDWGETTVLPRVCQSLNRILPIHSVRYRLIDSLSETTQGIVNSRFVKAGSNAATCAGVASASSARPLLYSTWCFPANDVSFVLAAYRQFCLGSYERTGYRTDIPATGYRIAKDASALLSPSFDEPMIALQTASTQQKGWDDHVIDLADFAESWGGVPIYSQSRALRAVYAAQVYSDRLEVFRRIRRQLDPQDRLLTPFLAQYFR